LAFAVEIPVRPCDNDRFVLDKLWETGFGHHSKDSSSIVFGSLVDDAAFDELALFSQEITRV